MKTAHRSVMALLSSAALLGAGVALAHHSFAMFDASKTVTLEGTLKLAELQNPHSWFWVAVPKDNGESQLWGAEGGAGGGSTVAELARKSNMTIKEFFAPGQKVTMTIHPLRDGRPGGQVLTIRFADGRQYGEAPAASQNSSAAAQPTP